MRGIDGDSILFAPRNPSSIDEEKNQKSFHMLFAYILTLWTTSGYDIPGCILRLDRHLKRHSVGHISRPYHMRCGRRGGIRDSIPYQTHWAIYRNSMRLRVRTHHPNNIDRSRYDVEWTNTL